MLYNNIKIFSKTLYFIEIEFYIRNIFQQAFFFNIGVQYKTNKNSVNQFRKNHYLR